MTGLSAEACDLLRTLICLIEPEALEYTQLTVQGGVRGAFCPVPVTDRPSEPLLPIVSAVVTCFGGPN